MSHPFSGEYHEDKQLEGHAMSILEKQKQEHKAEPKFSPICCGCMVGDKKIKFCSVHAAAEELLEACKMMLEAWTVFLQTKDAKPIGGCLALMGALVDKAEGRS